MGALLAAAAGGLLLLPFLSALPPAWLPLAGAAVLLLLACIRACRRLLVGGVFLLAFSWSVMHAARALEQRIPAAWEGQVLTVQGWVEGLPEAAERGVRFRFVPVALIPEDGSRPLPLTGRWQVFSAQPGMPEPQASCTLAVRLKRPHGVANAGGFDYEAWLLSEGVTATGSTRTLSCGKPVGFSFDGLRFRLRQHFSRTFNATPEAGVLLALISGDRALMPVAAWNLYAATGIVHLMAISGLHVTLLAAVVFGLALRLLRRFPELALRIPLHKPALLAGFGVALLYSLIAGLSVPTLRTLIMLGVVAGALCLERRLPAFHILLLALIAVLLWSPLAVHAAGFWLSFGAVALLMLLGQTGRELPLWRQALQTQFLVSLLLLPLTLWFFEQLSWVSPLANLLAVPLVTFVIVPLGLLGLLGWLCGLHAGAGLLWSGAMGLLALLDALLEQFAAWPAAHVAFSLPGAAGLLLLAAALACLLQPVQPRLRWLAPVFLLPLLFPAAPLRPGQLRLTLLDVGQGLAVLVETPGHRLLYDAGPALGPHADAGSRFILPALRRQGVHSLDRLVLSHADLDHTGGARTLLAGLRIGAGLGARPAAAALPPGLAWTDCRAGQRWRWDGWEFAVLFPSAEQAYFARNDNNRSCVLRISRGRASILLPGDIDRLAELSLLERFPAASLRSTVLVLAHHGSRSASSAEFLAVVQPRWALVSAGYRNAFRHPSEKVLERLRVAGIPLRNTARSGAITLLLDGSGTLHLGEFRRDAGGYWHK